MAFASATILVPLESSQFVTNVFFSKFINETHVSGRQWLGTWLAVLGTVFTCVFGPNDDRCFNIDMMISFWTAPGWIIYVIFTFSLSGLGWLMYGKLLAASKTEHPPQIAEVGLPALFAVSSALIGGAQMIVHSKALAELFDMLFTGVVTFPELFGHWFFWVELLITAGCGIFWAVQMNRSLTLYEPLFIIPLLQASYILFGAMGSGIFYQEFESLHEEPLVPVGYGAWFFYILGMLMVITGIMLLAPPSSVAACCKCLAPKLREPIVTLHDVEKRRPHSPGPDSRQPEPPGMQKQESGLELVAGLPAMGMQFQSFSQKMRGAGSDGEDGSPVRSWSIRANVDRAKGTHRTNPVSSPPSPNSHYGQLPTSNGSFHNGGGDAAENGARSELSGSSARSTCSEGGAPIGQSRTVSALSLPDGGEVPDNFQIGYANPAMPSTLSHQGVSALGAVSSARV